MSQQRTSSGFQQTRTTSSSSSSSSYLSSPSSSSARTHTPSSVPVIAGSLVGVIVLVACLVTILLLHKRRGRLRAERALRTARYLEAANFPPDQLGKHARPSSYGRQDGRPAQDSASSSGSCAPSRPDVPPHNHENHLLPELPTHHSPPQSPNLSQYPYPDNRSNHDPQPYQPLPPQPSPPYKIGQSSTSDAQTQVPVVSHLPSHRTSTPVPQPIPQASIQMTLDSSVPRGHAADAVVDDNNIASASPSSIFGAASGSGRGERRTQNEGLGGPNADVPSIVVTRDAEDLENGRSGQRGFEQNWRGDASGANVGEPPLVIANGVHSGNGNVERRSGIPEAPGGYSHAQGREQGGEEDHTDGAQQQGTSKARASISGSEYSYLASTSGSTDGAVSSYRLGDSDTVGLTPENTGIDLYERPRTTSTGSTSRSSPPLPTQPQQRSPPSSPTTSFTSSTPTLSGQNTQSHHPKFSERTNHNFANHTHLSPSLPPFTRQAQSPNRSYVGHSHTQAPIALSRLGTGAPTMMVEDDDYDAPPAYQRVWISEREEEERRERAERRRSEQGRNVRT